MKTSGINKAATRASAAPRQKVGYKSPPKQFQFKKGQSGNPLGRRKRTLTIEAMVGAELASQVVIVEQGRRNKASKLQLLIKQAVNLAVKGDFRPLQTLSKLTKNLEQFATQRSDIEAKLTPVDLSKMTDVELSNHYRQTIASLGSRKL